MVIVDTTVWIDYLRGTQNSEVKWLDSEMGRQRFALTDIILCEVLQGIPDDHLFNRIQRDLLQFEIFATGGTELALTSAQNFRILRQRGYTVRKIVDCLIATFCIMEGHLLLHRDRDFDPFEQFLGLSVLHV